jgi:hypothetical protein
LTGQLNKLATRQIETLGLEGKGIGCQGVLRYKQTNKNEIQVYKMQHGVL